MASLPRTMAYLILGRFAIAAYYLDRVGAGMAQAIDAAGNAFGRLEAMAGAYVGFALANPHRCRLLFGPEVKGSPYLVVHEAAGAVHGRFVGVVVECREAGQLPEEDPMKLAALMYATAHGAVGLALSGHTQEAEGLGEPLAPVRLPLAGLRIS